MNTMHSTSGIVGAADGDVMVTLNEHHRPTAEYVRELRERLPREFPGTLFYFLPADITTQILNFGLPAPIDIQLQSNDVEASTQQATSLLQDLRKVPGLVDLRIQQPTDYPTLEVDLDRTKAEQGGYTTRDVAQSMLNSLSGSLQITPMFYLNYKNGVNYNLVAQTPQYRMDTMQDIQNIPVNSSIAGAPSRATPEVLGDLSSIHRNHELAVVSHYNIRRVVDIYGAVQDRDLGATAKDVEAIVRRHEKSLPRGMFVSMRGQVQTMRSSYVSLLGGLVFAILLVYMLIVVNFQSWLDPFIIITALPAALAGIVIFLFLTHTTLSVPALMGAIMCMGVATANSILVVSFAKLRLAEHGDAILAAIEAGATRFRPVCMTALAMIIGMVPMALGLGDGGEQNAPLGRAVIGGLLCATVATLVFVPAVFGLLHGIKKGTPAEEAQKRSEQPLHA
jgi:multidrug efflux pump subunit AcrB